jgi:hypothetical protein
MRLMDKNMSIAAKLPWLLCALLITSGCQWAKPKVNTGAKAADTIESDHTSVNPKASAEASSQNCDQLLDENAKLQEELKTKDLDITKLNAELKYHTDRNRHLEQLCQSIQQDLTQAERQFISIEQRLQLKETKASAVSALAEAKLAVDKYKSGSRTDSEFESLAEIEQKLEGSSQLIKKENYAASVYYSNRVHKMLERAADKQTYFKAHGETRIVSVFKANLRIGPGLDHEVIGQLTFGSVLMQVEQSDEWSRIETEDGLEGWIHRELIH